MLGSSRSTVRRLTPMLSASIAAVTQPCGSASRRSINFCPFAVSEGRVSGMDIAPFF